MSHSVPQQQSRADAARGDAPSAPSVDRPLAGFPTHTPTHAHPDPHSPIDREIERSERASAALAATRALARASFTDSQLAADDLAHAEGDIDTSDWIRTEYAALDQTVRSPLDDATPPAPRNFVGGSFNPGIASMQGRAFPSASLAQTPIKTRTGAQARFMHESRQTPRADRLPSTMSLSGQASYDKPAVLPMLAPAMAPVPAKAPAAASRARTQPAESTRFLLAAGIGAIAVLLGGGLAWKAGMIPHNTTADAAMVTNQVAAQAEAARLLSAPPQQPIAITPAAGTSPTRTSEEVDAALAAAARAAAVPVAAVHAAGPAAVARPLPPTATLVTAPAPAVPVVAPTVSSRVPAKSKESVADAIARAQARSDSFLAPGASAAAPAPVDVKPQP